jgi:hypothetical protein
VALRKRLGYQLKGAVEAVDAQTNLDPNSISNKLFLLCRQDLDEVQPISSEATACIITPNIE